MSWHHNCITADSDTAEAHCWVIRECTGFSSNFMQHKINVQQQFRMFWPEGEVFVSWSTVQLIMILWSHVLAVRCRRGCRGEYRSVYIGALANFTHNLKMGCWIWSGTVYVMFSQWSYIIKIALTWWLLCGLFHFSYIWKRSDLVSVNLGRVVVQVFSQPSMLDPPHSGHLVAASTSKCHGYRGCSPLEV